MNEGESQARKAAPAARRFAADYTNPTSVLRSLAEAYPIKLIGGSDTPFQSYGAPIDRPFVSLRSTYAEEAACLHALPHKLKPTASQDNRLALLQLKDANLLSRR